MSIMPAASRFTEKQGQYLAFINAYTMVMRRPPAEADIQGYFGVTPPTVHQMVLTLAQAGLIRRTRASHAASNCSSTQRFSPRYVHHRSRSNPLCRDTSRSHLERSGFDLFVDGSEEDCLRFLEMLPFTDAPHWGRVSNFIIAEAAGRPVGALCGYFVEDTDGPIIGKAGAEVALQLGWSRERVLAGWRRVKSGANVAIERVPHSWIVECVAVLPEFQRKGIVTKLLDVTCPPENWSGLNESPPG